MTGTGRRKTARTGARQLADDDYRRLAEFRSLLRQFLTFSEAAAHGAGLTAQQHQALLAIKGLAGHGGENAVAVGTLAKQLGIRHHSAVGLIDRLATSGLVVRHRGESDRRQVLLSLTAKAEAILARLSLTHRDELKRFAPMLRRILKRI
jgi:DNA-binding MarR family transcriptional regulator